MAESKSLDQIKQENFEKLEKQKLDQSSGETKMIKASRNAEIEISDYDKEMVHVKTVLKINNERTKQYDENVKIQQYHPLFFDQNKDSLTLGYDSSEIVHDPRDAKNKARAKAKSSETIDVIPPNSGKEGENNDPKV